MICCLRSPIDVAGGMGKTSVGGRPTPGKDVKSTLIRWSDMTSFVGQ